MSTLPADAPTSTIRRVGPGADQRQRPADEPALRGVLHDVGHGLLTLSLLVDSARDALLMRLGSDVFELVEAEVARLLAMVHSGTRHSPEPTTIGLRSLLEPFALVSRRTTLTKVWVRPGPEVFVRTDPAMIWRIIANLLDNAVRAAGPLGNVELAANTVNDVGRHAKGRGSVIIDVIDDGPGFERGPLGLANLGLTVVHRLLESCGGRLQIDGVLPYGTRMRVVLPVSRNAGVGRPAHADADALRGTGRF